MGLESTFNATSVSECSRSNRHTGKDSCQDAATSRWFRDRLALGFQLFRRSSTTQAVMQVRLKGAGGDAISK